MKRIFAALAVIGLSFFSNEIISGNEIRHDGTGTVHGYSYLVTNNMDDNSPGCLRYVVNNAQDGDSIFFSQGLSPITLSNGEIQISKSISITGNGKDQTIIQADPNPRVADHRIFNISGVNNVSINGMTLQNGRVLNPGYGDDQSYGGAALFKNCHSVSISGCDIKNNNACNDGGGLCFKDCQIVTITNSSVENNQSRNGGGLYIITSDCTLSLLIQNSTISNNTAYNFGGIQICSGNTSLSAIDAYIVNSTVANNFAYLVGGVNSSYSSLYVVNSTITNNRDTYENGGVRIIGCDNYIVNSIIAGNSSRQSPDLEVLKGAVTSTVSAFNSIIGICTNSTLNPSPSGSIPDVNGNFIGTGTAPVNPMIQPLADNGGATYTCALLPGSIAVGNGRYTNPSIVIQNLIPHVDQRGNQRSATAPDIGSFELPVSQTAK